jgi:hypothetical protein
MSDPTDLKELKSMDSFALPASNPTSGSMPQNMGLADLARGLQYVVNEAAMAAHLHMQKTLDLYFDAEGNPRCRRVHLPGGGGSVDVPVIALTPPANLMLEQMEVALAVRVTNLRPVTDAARSAPESEQSAESTESECRDSGCQRRRTKSARLCDACSGIGCACASASTRSR